MPVLSERIVLKDQTCPVIRLDKTRRSDKSVGFSISLGLHIVIFILVGVSFVKPPQFGVERGFGGIEVELMRDEPDILVQEPIEPDVEQENDFGQQQEILLQEINKERNMEVKEQDQVAMRSTGGAMTEAKPDYLKNPAPVYPDAARRLKQEGVVVLFVSIDRSGSPLKVEIKESSGHTLLDQAAMKAVKKWRFRPALLGSVAIDASVHVPIRFDLVNDNSNY